MKYTFMENFKDKDPEFYDFYSHFISEEVINDTTLDDKSRYLSIIAVLVGTKAQDLFKDMLDDLLKYLTADEIQEVLYQAVAYLGIGMVYPFLNIMNRHVNKPLKSASTTNRDNRIELGNEKQCELFGEHMRGFQTSGPEEERHIKRWLAGNCFGDNYTRIGLTGAQREMITFCFLAALGTEPQLKSHIGGNFHVGNDAHYLLNVISNCMPYIGYPRTLNAIRCIHEMEK